MKIVILLVFILLAVASPSGQSLIRSSFAMNSNSWRFICLAKRNGKLIKYKEFSF